MIHSVYVCARRENGCSTDYLKRPGSPTSGHDCDKKYKLSSIYCQIAHNYFMELSPYRSDKLLF